MIIHKLFKNLIVIFFAVLLLFIFSGCSAGRYSGKHMQSSDSSSYYSLGYSEFDRDISEKEEILSAEGTNPSSEEDKAELLRELIILYSHKKNPDPDFVMALKYLKQYALIKNQISVEYVEALLDIMIEKTLACNSRDSKYKKALKDKKKLERVRRKLIEEIRSKDEMLQENAAEIKEKNEIIEKLKALDIKLEHRRIVTE